MSVYPQKGNPSVRKDLNRLILPNTDALCQKAPAIYLMWTSTRDDEMVHEHWVPNHFTALIPVGPPSSTATVSAKEEMSFTTQ